MQLSHEQLGKRYTLLNLLDSGNMADVYLAWDEEEKHQVAIKVIKPDMHYPSLLQRFAREGNLAASLDHAHIIRTYACEEELITNTGEKGDSEVKILYIVMEYIEGGNLKQWLKLQKPRTLADILRIIEQLCAAVQYLHYKGVIHRDIKPANILFREPPQEGKQIEIVLSDFGLALLAEDTHVSLPQAGTPAYMAPEQWFGNPKFASDIFSLGVVFYQLCTGHNPSSSRPLETPTRLNPSLPLALDEVILLALSNDPSERFASASLFWQAIQSAVEPTTQSFILLPPVPLGVIISNPLPLPLPLKTGVVTQSLPKEPGPSSPLIPPDHVPQPNRYRPMLIAATLIVVTIFFISLALPVVGILLAAPTVAAKPSTIAITPTTLTVQDSYVLQGLTSNANPNNRQVTVRQLTSTKTDTKTVNLAHFHQDAVSAIGKITLFNGSSNALTVPAGTIIQVDNVKVAIDEQAVVPAARLIPGSAPQYGQGVVRAHTVQGGITGNIAVFTINQFCCDGAGRIVAENLEVFNGGKDAIDYNYLKQEDVNAVTNADQGTLTTNAQNDIKGQVKAGEKLLGAINCASPNTTEDVKPNDPQPGTVTTAHVTVSVSCSAQVTDGNGVQTMAQKALQDQASKNPGTPYTQAGAIVVTEPQSPQIQQNGITTFSVTAKGVWYYPWTTAMMQDVLNKVKGISKAQAQAILNGYPGVGQANITLTNGATLLPSDPILIMLSVSTVAGLSAGK